MKIALSGVVSKTFAVLLPCFVWGSLSVSAASSSFKASDLDEITVYTAKKIITMDPRYPEAKVVAVRAGEILSVGRNLADLAPWLDRYPHHIDNTFKGKVLMPGFIDPHLHPMLAALFLPHDFAAPDTWHFPDKVVEGVVGREAFLQRVTEDHLKKIDNNEWLLMFGWAEAAHGKITRDDLNAISRDRPIAISSRSTHSMILNDKALQVLGVTAELAAAHPMQHELDYDNGLFAESANFLMVAPRLAPIIFAPQRLQKGLTLLRDMAHSAGITTMAEPGAGLVAGGGDLVKEMKMMAPVLDRDDTPFRTYLFPSAYASSKHVKDADKLVAYVDSLSTLGSQRLKVLPKKIKFLYDGSYVDQLGIYDAPGYIDGHEGLRIDPPALFDDMIVRFWEAGYGIHVHVQGDGGTRKTIDTLAALQERKPRFDHRFVMEHMGQTSIETLERAARLGASVSALIYPLYSMGQPFAEKVLGHDRMEMAFPYQEVLRLNMKLALHSDTPVAPPNPLRNAWISVNRENAAGGVIGERQALSVHQAMRAITIDAAHMLGLEDEIGSIRAGKKADFTVLESDPYRVRPSKLTDIDIWGTVLEGRLYPVNQ
jgi:predicted amidohydrolase YtcJ